MFGQLVFGPPGSGKTTYCQGMAEFLQGMGRKVSVVNLDPANEGVPYEPAVDVRDLVTLEQVMYHEKLGPNGAFIFAAEYLNANVDWLLTKLLSVRDTYLLIDCPGQIELYTHHDGMRELMSKLQKQGDISLCAVMLVDSVQCCSAPNFISAVLVSLSTMLQLELPHVNILTKVDLLNGSYGPTALPLDYFTEVQDLSYLLRSMGGETDESAELGVDRYRRLQESVADTVEDFGLVSFLPLDISDKELCHSVMQAVDRANGCAFTGLSDSPGVYGHTAQVIQHQYDAQEAKLKKKS